MAADRDADDPSTPEKKLTRIRLACTGCRRRKIRCSGEQPVCIHCRRSRERCIYVPLSADRSSEVLRRLQNVESQLTDLGSRGGQEKVPDAASPPSTLPSPEYYATGPGVSKRTRFADHDERRNLLDDAATPSPAVVQSLVDTYFVHVHNQPYSYFHEASFRHTLANGEVPACLLLAVLPSALRFSDHEHYRGRTHEMIETYARQAWRAVLENHLTVEEVPSLHVVQTVNMLAVVDFTAGRLSSGWLKIGLAVRFSQDLRLMVESSAWLSSIEQEERRHVFWSVYLLDKLVTCGRSRPSAIADEDCHVQLPCDGHGIGDPGDKERLMLDQLLRWNPGAHGTPGKFALTVLTASMLGRCARYVLQERFADETLPWDPRSEFTSINSSLLLVESHLQSQRHPLIDCDATVEGLDHLLFAHVVFHLCHCLLNHPFLRRMQMKRLQTTVPPNFAARMLETCLEHATQLTNLLDESIRFNHPIRASFYVYATTIVGALHSMRFHHLRHRGEGVAALDYLARFQQSLGVLEKMFQLWDHALTMRFLLRQFHTRAHRFCHVFDMLSPPTDLDRVSEEILWSMVDYNEMCSGGKFGPSVSAPIVLDPSRRSCKASSTTDGTEGDLPLPGVCQHEIDYVLNMSPPANFL